MKIRKNSWNFWLIGTSCLFFMGIILAINYFYAVNLDEKHQGIFGDMFGASNALFTGLSFVGVIIAILLQRQDINNQKEDAKIQSYEATFFNLLNFHRETVVSLEKHYTKVLKTGTQSTREEYSKKGVQLIRTIYVEYLDKMPGDKKFNKHSYNSVYKANWDVLGHYYRGVQAILDYIDRLHLVYSDAFYYKKIYIDIFKAQLSEYETAMIFYHFLSLEDSRYKNIAEKYSFFEYINDELITDDKLLYKKGAF